MSQAEHKARLSGDVFLADITHEIYVQSLSDIRLSRVIMRAICGTSTAEQDRVLRRVFKDVKEVVVSQILFGGRKERGVGLQC